MADDTEYDDRTREAGARADDRTREAGARADDRTRGAGARAAGREDAHPSPPPASAGDADAAVDERPFLRIGRYAWAFAGVLVILVAAGLLAGELRLLWVPLVIALFPAALLSPVTEWLKRHRVPTAAAAIGAILALLFGIAAIIGVLIPIVAAELPDLIESFEQGVGELEGFLQNIPVVDIDGLDELLEQGQEMIGEVEGLAGQAMTAATTVVEGVVAVLFGLVVLFFYLKDGEQIAKGIRDLLPGHMQSHAEAIGGRVWWTVGSYFRGQLLVAFVDAIFIGLGLLLLGVPLAVPLAVLVFFGGLFPIVGAVVSGALAVVVALADAGPVIALVVLALILAVQQIESNVLEPVIMSRAIALHPLAVIVAITAGGITLGILGAFIAVPVAASIGRVVDYLHGRPPPSEDQAESEEEARSRLEEADGDARDGDRAEDEAPAGARAPPA